MYFIAFMVISNALKRPVSSNITSIESQKVLIPVFLSNIRYHSYAFMTFTSTLVHYTISLNLSGCHTLAREFREMTKLLLSYPWLQSFLLSEPVS